MNLRNVSYLPVFTGFTLRAQPGTGLFCLYHGNLSVAENEAAVVWLMEEVFNSMSIPFIIAGKRPSAFLKRLVRQHRHASLISDPSNEVLNDLIEKAQCHVLPSLNDTGVKLKIIHALYTGRHCIVNEPAVRGSGVDHLCILADTASSFKDAVWKHYQLPMSNETLEKRNLELQRIFDVNCQTQELIRWLS